MALDTTKVNQKIPVNAGTVLFEEGSPANSLNVIHEGGMIIEKQVGNLSIPIFRINGKNLTPGVLALFESGRYPFTIKASENSVVSTYAVTTNTIKKTIQGKLSLGVMVARSLLREIIETVKRINQIQGLTSRVDKLCDNLGLIYYILEPAVFPDINVETYVYDPDMEIPDPVSKHIRKTLSEFIQGGGKLPDIASVIFLNEDHGEWLKKSYSEEIEFDDSEFLLVRRLLSIDPNLSNPVFEADPNILIYLSEKLSKVYTEMLELLAETIEELNTAMQLLVSGEFCYLEKYYSILDIMETGISEEKPEHVLPITEVMSEVIGRSLAQYRNIFLREYSGTSPNVKNFQEKSRRQTENLSPEAIASASSSGDELPIHAGLDIDAMKKELEGSTAKILNFVKLPAEQAKEFNALMIKLKSMKNPLDPESDARKIRKNISKTYWEVYENAAVKYFSNKSVPKPVEMMLKFGFFDETLLDVSHISVLYTHIEPPDPKSPIPTIMCQEWLEKIYNKETTTSLDELGQTYFEKIKLESKDVVYKKESDIPANVDTAESRLKYEMNAMYVSNVRLTTGNPSTHLPILTRYHITLPLDKCLVSRQVLKDAVNEIINVDYTCFNREVVYNDESKGIRSEFVQKSVIPDFIIVPSIGGKVMMWQPLSILKGFGAKESRGRIIIPILANGDIKTMILEAIGAFRWELCKEILGPDWNNVGIPSVTSEYTDYVQFFKKNKDLSIELKEKIATEFKRFRTDRDKFINDYLAWVKYESEGIQRLNRVVRSIFYKHIPFKKDIRDKVSKLPAYADMHNRFINIRNRRYKELETRYKKYMDGAGKYPPVLQENIDFYKV